MLVVSDSVSQAVARYTTNLPHALLLQGVEGVGLMTIARTIAEQTGSLAAIIQPEAATSASTTKSISVDRIRTLYEITKVRHTKPHIIIIDDADRMNHAAQNALLKLVEEPANSIHFILTSHRHEVLLPTIISRVQQLAVPAISEEQSLQLLDSLRVSDQVKRQQLLYIGMGLPAELTRLASDAAAFETLRSSVQKARTYIQSNTYDKVAVIQSLKDDRAEALRFIQLVMRLMYLVSKTSITREQLRTIDRLMEAHTAIEQNGNVRLQLMTTVLY